MDNDSHTQIERPSDWVVRWAPRIAKSGRVLDLACGSGRHARWLAAQGYAVEAVDRDAAALASLAGCAGIATRVADLEGAPWPYAEEQFDGIVVTNYLHRPLFPALLDALAPASVLIYETFALGNERFGRPRNPDFLLKPGELLRFAHGRLEVIAYENVTLEFPRPAVVQRICALNAPRGCGT